MFVGVLAASLPPRQVITPRLDIGSMQGRARLLGGEFEIHSEPGKGASIEVRVPLLSNTDQAKS